MSSQVEFKVQHSIEVVGAKLLFGSAGFLVGRVLIRPSISSGPFKTMLVLSDVVGPEALFVAFRNHVWSHPLVSLDLECLIDGEKRSLTIGDCHSQLCDYRAVSNGISVASDLVFVSKTTVDAIDWVGGGLRASSQFDELFGSYDKHAFNQGALAYTGRLALGDPREIGEACPYENWHYRAMWRLGFVAKGVSKGQMNP